MHFQLIACSLFVINVAPALADAPQARASEVLDRVPNREALYQQIAKHGDSASARAAHVQVSGTFVHYEKRRAADNLPKLYVRNGWHGQERLLVDPQRLQASGAAHYAIDYYKPSPDNRYVAYGISLGGSEQSVLHVLEVATSRETGVEIARNGGPLREVWDRALDRCGSEDRARL